MAMLLMKVYVGAFIRLMYDLTLSLRKLGGGVFDKLMVGGELLFDEVDDDEYEEANLDDGGGSSSSYVSFSFDESNSCPDLMMWLPYGWYAMKGGP